MQFLLNHRKKKISKFQVAALVSILPSILFLSDISSAGSRTESVAVVNSGCRNFIGRVSSSGDLYLPSGSRLCQGDRINPAKGATVKVLCYLNGNFVYLKHSTVFKEPDTCTVPQEITELCTGLNPSNCYNPKGAGEEKEAPTLISPYGSSMLSTRPLISWSAVSNATNYTVIVKGYEFYWEATVDQKTTTLAYPKEQIELQLGNTYKITVIANLRGSLISSEPLVISILPEKDQKEIAYKVKQINELNLPPDEAAFLDLDAVFMSKSLLNESIETLKTRVAAGSQNPTLYRVLADRYLEAWLPNEALRNYQVANELAKRTRNSDELARVQQRLKLVEWHNR
ncbi:hypothetical protein NIES4072_69680 [Nostoc commune NIES-4072]|uniref:Fibronectin type-III domain-containing protein n=1 Tax=Nostoc commune NIES-4072 TaxID=2005467 RepID=A0A2R5FWW3_NOSCO|nr:hypothetical protein NIES4070_70120 [Nostoc commune HK-02]GBG23256.1 hypothetical protein NIES4072_69680 [Nostoc commune NIES-4072]